MDAEKPLLILNSYLLCLGEGKCKGELLEPILKLLMTLKVNM